VPALSVTSRHLKHVPLTDDQEDFLDPTAFRGPNSAGIGLVDRSQAALPLHLLPETAEIAPSGHLSIGGVDVLTVADEVGTPVFVYDEQHLRSRCREARRAFGEGVAYASKAFLCRAMAALAHEEGMMLDVASGGEMYVALRAGVPPERLVLHGNNKSPDELALALVVGVGRIVVDSFDEIDRLDQLVGRVERSTKPRVLVRINPGTDVCTHPSMATGQQDSKFGFSLSSGAAEEAISRLAHGHGPVDIVGLHTHIGSQVLDFSAISRTINALAELVRRAGLTEFCVGGGLGVSYTGGDDRSPSLTDWAMAIRQACHTYGVPDSVRITAEPGRAIAAAAAITCYTIGTIKSIRLPSAGIDRIYVSVDGGMSDNLRPALYDSAYEAFLPKATGSHRPLEVTVAGKHCESGDILVRNGRLPDDPVVGDVLAMPMTGAYGYAMASNYNKIPRPPIVFVDDGRYRVVTRRETYEDLLLLDT
jgi:diaminopimelate decarboxylase